MKFEFQTHALNADYLNKTSKIVYDCNRNITTVSPTR